MSLVTVPTLNVDDAISDAFVDAVSGNLNFLKLERLATALSLGPPISPSDGDIWVAKIASIGVGAGKYWVFKYDASEASAYKWKFIGGSPVCGRAVGPFSPGAAYSVMGGVGIGGAAMRGGHYRVVASGGLGAVASGGATSDVVIGIGINSTTTISGNFAEAAITASSGSPSLAIPLYAELDTLDHATSALPAGGTFWYLASGAGSGTVGQIALTVVPTMVA